MRNASPMNVFNTTIKAAITACVVGAMALPASAAIAPYTADGNTLHLWHFDDASSPATASVGGIDLNANNGATLNNAALSGFGTSGNTSAGTNSEFESAGNVAGSAVQAANGSFTMDALINTANITDGQQIVSLSNAGGDQVFQFRMTGGNLQFIKVGGTGGTDSDNSIAIPTSGANAFVAGAWYHAAVTYDGNDGAADNLKLYWTRVGENVTRANLLASFSLNADLPTTSLSPLRVGNRVSGNNLEGSIDEVRISDNVRIGDGFVFGKSLNFPILLADNFNTASTGINDDLGSRQSGLLANTNYNENTTVSIGSNQAQFGVTSAISPDVDFNTGVAATAIANGGGFVIDFDVNPVSDASDNGANGNWLAVSIGRTLANSTSTAPGITQGDVDFGLLFRDSGTLALWDGGVNTNTPSVDIFDASPTGGEVYNIRLVVETLNANAGTAASVSLFVNGVQFDLTDGAGLTYAFTWDANNTNYIAFENRGNASTFDNLVIGAIPTPAALPAGLALIGLVAARRRR